MCLLYLKIKHCLFYLYIMCICNVHLCSYFFITKKKKDKDFYLRPLWPKYPPLLFIFCYLERLCLYNREISLVVLLRQTGKSNMTKNPDKIVKCLKKKLYDIFAISPTPTWN